MKGISLLIVVDEYFSEDGNERGSVRDVQRWKKEDGSKRREEEIEKEGEERMGEEEKEGGRGKDKEGEGRPGLLPKWEKKKRWKGKKGRKGKKGEKRVKGKVYRHPQSKFNRFVK